MNRFVVARLGFTGTSHAVEGDLFVIKCGC